MVPFNRKKNVTVQCTRTLKRSKLKNWQPGLEYSKYFEFRRSKAVGKWRQKLANFFFFLKYFFKILKKIL